jgi:periplasmic protein TonB
MHERLTGVVLSAALHLIVVPLGALALTHTHARAAALPAPRRSLTFVTMRPASAFVAAGVASAPVPRPAPARPPVFTPTTIPPDEPADIRPPDTDTPTPVAPEVAESPVETALREAPVEDVPKPAAPPVRVGAFERARAPQTAVQERAAVTSAGFSSTDSAQVAVATSAPLLVGALQNDRIDAPAEIVFKPEPRYTEEAQALGIEGTVVLEVEFSASNGVRVVRTVRGLGHGLDEAAARAAEQIRFKPARRGGIPVDCRVTIRIDFRLA